MSDFLDLADYRRRVSEMYAAVRDGGSGRGTWLTWVQARDELFSSHPQSPIEDLGRFTGLDYFDYSPDNRTTGVFIAGDRTMWGEFERIGKLVFSLHGSEHQLPIYWLNAYGGGLFLPFRDQTNGDETYGGGRYLLDSVKGADLGRQDGSIVLDFNFAYHPSCAHSTRWACPLAEVDSRLNVRVEAGERLPFANGEHQV